MMTKFCSPKIIVLILSFFILLLFTKNSYSQTNYEERVISVSINGEKKGDLFCFFLNTMIYLPIKDLKDLGLKKLEGEIKQFDGKDYILLNTLKDVKFNYDEEKLELDIIVPPSFLPETYIDLAPKRRGNIIIPFQNSAFLNYRFDYTNLEKERNLYLNHELGIRYSDITLLTQGFYNNKDNKYTRLDTSLYYDNRNNLTRFIFGDFLSPSSLTSSGNKMFGISFFRHFSIDPYYIYKPTFDIKTFATFRSDVEIYLDDVLIKKESVSPGEINLLDLYHYGGRKDIKIIIKDPFGREQIFSQPIYFTDLMLKKGIRDFNYSIGFLRENYFTESSHYTYPGIVLIERYGVNDFLNIGGRLENIPAKDYLNINGELISLLNKYGVLGLIGAYSNFKSKSGTAILTSYTFQEKNLGLRITGLKATKNYMNNINPAMEQIKKSFSFSASYYIQKLGNFSFDFMHNKYVKDEKNILNFGYSRSIKGNISLFANLTKRYEKTDSTEFFLGISYYPKKDYTISARMEDIEARESNVIQISKSAPIGEGYGYRITLEREKINNYASIVNPYLQYRMGYGIFEGDAYLKKANDRLLESYRLAYSGAIAYTGGQIGLTRPINDSFGIIKTAELSDVKVELNGQYIGKTNKKGYIFLPDLNSYYDNLITINDKDIPFEYDILTKEIAVSPWYKSGFCLKFPIKKIYRYSGKLFAINEDGEKPLEFNEIIIKNGDDSDNKENDCIILMDKTLNKYIKITTGKGGEFYIENLIPGKYEAEVLINDNPYKIELILSDNKDYINDIGVIKVMLLPKTQSEKTYNYISETKDVLNLEYKNEKIKEFNEQDMVNLKQEKNKTETKIYMINFKFNSTKMASKKDYETLNEIIKLLREQNDLSIIISGHCDQLGSKSYNYKLGHKRAKFVKNYLIKMGIKPSRILKTGSFGKDKLLCDSIEESCRKLNRRVEIHFIEQ